MWQNSSQHQMQFLAWYGFVFSHGFFIFCHMPLIWFCSCLHPVMSLVFSPRMYAQILYLIFNQFLCFVKCSFLTENSCSTVFFCTCFCNSFSSYICEKHLQQNPHVNIKYGTTEMITYYRTTV